MKGAKPVAVCFVISAGRLKVNLTEITMNQLDEEEVCKQINFGGWFVPNDCKTNSVGFNVCFVDLTLFELGDIFTPPPVFFE